MKNHKPTQLDSLIRGEMAAVECYDVALAKIKDTFEKNKITELRKDHVKAVEVLKRYASPDVIIDASDSGIWGGFATAVTGSASLFGHKAALKALKVGEEHGVKEYKEALNDKNIKFELKQIIQTELLPNQEKHISAIETFNV